MKLIVCLGNYPKEYKKTRHNIGFRVGDECVDTFSLNKVGKKFKSIVYEGVIEGERVFLIYPQTYMNVSGEAVQVISSFYKIATQDICVIYDDVDLDFGVVRFREKGSPGTHNGMKNIVQLINSNQFPRLRLGVGPIPEHLAIQDFVLQNFSNDEESHIDKIAKRSVKALSLWISTDCEAVMSKVNGSVL